MTAHGQGDPFRRIPGLGHRGCLLRRPTAFGLRYDLGRAELNTVRYGRSSRALYPWWYRLLGSRPCRGLSASNGARRRRPAVHWMTWPPPVPCMLPEGLTRNETRKQSALANTPPGQFEWGA